MTKSKIVSFIYSQKVLRMFNFLNWSFMYKSSEKFMQNSGMALTLTKNKRMQQLISFGALLHTSNLESFLNNISEKLLKNVSDGPNFG
jgi:hypothetical protein